MAETGMEMEKKRVRSTGTALGYGRQRPRTKQYLRKINLGKEGPVGEKCLLLGEAGNAGAPSC